MIIKEHVILALDEQISKKRQELIDVTKKYDIVCSEIAEQRRGKNEVYTQKVAISSELFTIESILEETKKIMDKERYNFANLTDKQKNTLGELQNQINEFMKKVAENEGKVIIDIDSANRKSKLAIGKKNKELQDLIDRAEEKKKEIATHDEKMKKEREEIRVEKEKLLSIQSNFEKREKDIRIKEKRLLSKK